MRRKAVLASATLLSLAAAGCSTPDYRPYRSGVGYSEAQIAPREFDVIYEGPDSMSVGEAVELAKVRAAEVALLNGKPHFEILEREAGQTLEADYDPGLYGGGPRLGVGLGTGYRRGVGVGLGTTIGTGFGGGYDVDDHPVAVLRVVLLDEPTENSFDADVVLADARARGLLPEREER